MSHYLLPSRPWLFLPNLARVIGVREAVIAQQTYWIINDLGVDELEWGWTDFEEIFDFIKPRTLRRVVDGMVEEGIILRTVREGRKPLIRIDKGRIEALAGMARGSGRNDQGSVQTGQGNPGQIDQGDLIIRYILKKYIFPLNGESENEMLERLRIQNPYQLIVTWWNVIAKEHGFVLCSTDNFHRPGKVDEVIKQGFIDHLDRIELALKSNPFYSGGNDTGWVVTLDWLLKEGKWTQVVDRAGPRTRLFDYKKAIDHFTKRKGPPSHSNPFPGNMFEQDQATGKWKLLID